MSGPAPALGVYVHWPYCARICPYCDFNVVRARGRTDEAAELVEAIVADLRDQAGRVGARTLVSIYFGGGTPSLMAPEAVARILATAQALWPGPGEVEVSLEANPTDAEADRFAAFRDAGVGRLSLGAQAFDEADLTFLGRNHGPDETRRAIALAAATFSRLSLDLIYALPGHTPVGWADTLRRAVATGAEHLSPYQLTIEAGTAFDRAVRRKRFVVIDEELSARLYETTQVVLGTAGYSGYEISNHARGPAARARHNLVYWRGEDYLGVGPGAHGRLTGPDGVRLASAAERSIRRYIAAVRETGSAATFTPMTSVDRAEERLLMGLRTNEGVGRGEVSSLPMKALPALLADGLLAQRGDRLIATSESRMVLDYVTKRLIVG